MDKDIENRLAPDLGWLLYETSRRFSSSLDLDEVLGSVLSLTVRVLKAKFGSIFLLDEKEKVTRSILARENLSPEVREFTVGKVMEKGFGGWIYRHGQADIIHDTDRDDRWYKFPDDHLVTRSVIAAPLMRQDRVIGIITLSHPEPGHFNAEQLDLIKAIAGEAAMAVENASLYKRIKDEHDMLKRLDKLKNEFVAQVAHDLKTPLGVIYGYAGVLYDIASLNAEDKMHIKEILSAVENMKKFISTVLDINRIEMGIEGDFEETGLDMIVRDAVRNLKTTAKKKEIALVADLPESLPFIHGAPIRLSQAVTNLIDNAIKFTPAGGTVRVTARRVDCSQFMAHGSTSEGTELSAMNHEPDRSFIEVSVADTGPGIPEELQANLFRKFSRLKQKETRKEEGHGLGLAIVKSIIEAHKGYVRVKSTPGRGSTFSFSVPLRSPIRI